MENGIEARVHTLEAQMIDIKDDLAVIRDENRDEHKDMRCAIGKIQGIGWVIVGGMVVGLFLMMAEKL